MKTAVLLKQNLNLMKHAEFIQPQKHQRISLLRHYALQHVQITLLISMIRSRLMRSFGMDETQRHGSPTPTDKSIDNKEHSMLKYI